MLSPTWNSTTDARQPQGWVAISILGTISAILAIIRELHNSLTASMTAHAPINGVKVKLLLLHEHSAFPAPVTVARYTAAAA